MLKGVVRGIVRRRLVAVALFVCSEYAHDCPVYYSDLISLYVSSDYG
jgi:hypothetical protein